MFFIGDKDVFLERKVVEAIATAVADEAKKKVIELAEAALGCGEAARSHHTDKMLEFASKIGIGMSTMAEIASNETGKKVTWIVATQGVIAETTARGFHIGEPTDKDRKVGDEVAEYLDEDPSEDNPEVSDVLPEKYIEVATYDVKTGYKVLRAREPLEYIMMNERV